MTGLYLWAVVLVSMVTLGCCGNYTVTDEAWFEVEIKDLDGPGIDYRGRFTMALFGEAAPVTVLNFRSITQGYTKGKSKLSYKNSLIHRIVPDFVIQMGDITVGDGSGSISIYGQTFADEEFVLSHRAPGWVAMANYGPDTNGSQFYIVMNKARWLDGSHVVFGKIIRGYDVIRTMGEVEVDRATSRPKRRMRIVDCGMEEIDRKYELEEDLRDSTDDL